MLTIIIAMHIITIIWFITKIRNAAFLPVNSLNTVIIFGSVITIDSAIEPKILLNNPIFSTAAICIISTKCLSQPLKPTINNIVCHFAVE